MKMQIASECTKLHVCDCKIFLSVLTPDPLWSWLPDLCPRFGKRKSGSPKLNWTELAI